MKKPRKSDAGSGRKPALSSAAKEVGAGAQDQPRGLAAKPSLRVDPELPVPPSIPEACFSLDREWRFDGVNQAAERLLGLTREELVRRNIWELFPPAVGSRFQAEYERAMAGSQTVDFEEFYPPVGRWFAVRALPSAAGLAIYFRDITERREVEARLHASEEQFHWMLECSNDAIFWADAETGVILRCNRKAEELAGRTRAELIGMHQTQLHPLDRDYAKLFQQMAALPAMENIELEVLSQTGKRTPVLVNTSVTQLGEQKVIQGIFRDITERKGTEKYREIGYEILRLLNERGGLQSIFRRVAARLKAETGFDAVGLRLSVGEDFPYFAQEGFPPDFLRADNSLVAHAANGEVRRDQAGKACLECLCGMVISGRIDPNNPHFTRRGSWWANHPVTPGEVVCLRPRNLCLLQGYASQALVPIRDQDKIVGLLQFTDRRKGCFTLNTIELLEEIAAQIGTALTRKQAEVALQAASEQRRLALEAAGVGTWDYHLDTGEAVWDERCRNQWGLREGGQIDYAAVIAAIHPDDRAGTVEAVQRALAGAEAGAFHREFRVLWPDGSKRWIDSYGQVHFEGEGESRRAIRFIGANRDITQRKEMEKTQEFLSRSSYPSSGEDFFHALARFLAQTLGMDFVCIDRLAGDGLAAQTVAVYSDGKFADNVAYALKDTPCGDVVGQAICCFPNAVRQRFPQDAVLQEMKAESYVGTTLWSFDGKPIGLIAIISRHRLANPGLAESVLKLVAVRAAGELERQQTEAALRESETRSQMAQQAGRVGTFERNLRTGAIIWSEELETIYGLPAGGFDGSIAAWQERVHPADLPALQASLAQALAERGDFRVEYRVVWPDGTIHWVAATGKVLSDARGEPARTVGVSIDITERKRAEEALRESEERFRELFENSPDAVFVEDATGTVLDANPAAGQLHGLSREALLGKNVLDLVPPEAREKVRDQFPEWFKPGITTREGVSYLVDGRTLAVEISGTSIRYRDQAAVLLHVRDVTRRKQAEEEVRALNAELEQRVAARTATLQQMNEQLSQEVAVRRQAEQDLTETRLCYRTVADFTHDWEYWETMEFVLRYCSPSCERITGYSAQEFIADPRLLQRIVYPEDASIWEQHRAELWGASVPTVIQFRIRKKDGSVRWMEHAWQAVRGEDGMFLGVRASNRDITDRKEREIEFLQMREKLATMSRITLAGQFAASLAHELNQPLTAILCNAETAQHFLAEEPLKVAEVRETLSDIVQDSERASGVIRRLRAMFNKAAPERSGLQINEVIRETLDLLRSELVTKGVILQVQLEPTVPRIMGNHIELQQVVLNLVVNALEAMSGCEPGQRRLQIATARAGPGEIRASIRDAGPGIQVQPISRLFEPFFTTKATGMGMGLAISHAILEGHGGSLEAANNPDRGATFYLTLPVPPAEPA